MGHICGWEVESNMRRFHAEREEKIASENRRMSSRQANENITSRGLLERKAASWSWRQCNVNGHRILIAIVLVKITIHIIVICTQPHIAIIQVTFTPVSMSDSTLDQHSHILTWQSLLAHWPQQTVQELSLYPTTGASSFCRHSAGIFKWEQHPRFHDQLQI